MLAIVPPAPGAPAAGRALPERRCASAGDPDNAVIATSAAASTASHRYLTRLGTNPPPLVLAIPRTGIVSGHEALHNINDPGVNEVVPCGKHHQRQHQRQTDPEAVFLRPLAQRLSADSFCRIEQQVAAVN